MKFVLNESNKFILSEKFFLEESKQLIEKIDKLKYPNIIKFYPAAAEKDSSWADAKLPDVSKFDKYMKKYLEEYFGASWITKDQCDELIKTAAKYKPNGNNFSETKALFNKFRQQQKEKVESSADWYELYKQCGDAKDRVKAYDAFWNGGLPLANEENPNNLPIAANDKIKKGYYVGEWGEQAELIKAFGSHFTKLLSKYGWSEKINQFIAYLKILFKIKPITINDASFAHVIEAVDNRSISEKDLRGNGLLEKANLIFNPQLYTKSTELVQYLQCQHKFISKHKTLPKDVDFKRAYLNIFSSDGNKDKLNDNAALNAAQANSFNFKLRPLEDLKILIKNIFDDEDEEDIVIKKATDKQVEDISKAIGDANTAKKFLSYLINTYRVFEPKLISGLNSSLLDKLTLIKTKVPTSIAEDETFDMLIKRTSTKFDADQFEKIVAAIVKKAGI